MKLPNTFIALIVLMLLSFHAIYLVVQSTPSPSTLTPRRVAFVCYLTGSTHLVQALMLGYSLKLVNSTHERVIMVTNYADEFLVKTLELYFDRVIPISFINVTGYSENIEPRGNKTITSLTSKFPLSLQKEVEVRATLVLYTSKLRLLQLKEYDVVIYMGTDQIVLKNIDQVADCPTPCGVVDTLLQAMVLSTPVINGDFLVLKPSQIDFENIVNNINLLWFEYRGTYPFGPYDQYAINHYYLGRMTALPYELAGLEVKALEKHQHFWNEELHVLHWASYPRPWEITKAQLKITPNQEILQAFESWWNIEEQFCADMDVEFKNIWTKKYPKACNPKNWEDKTTNTNNYSLFDQYLKQRKLLSWMTVSRNSK